MFGKIDGENHLEEFGQMLDKVQLDFDQWQQRELSGGEQDRLERTKARLDSDRERFRASKYHWEDFQGEIR